MLIYDGRNDRKAFPTKRTAEVISAGRIVCGENDQMTIRKKGREDWSLFYCESGILYLGNCVLDAGSVWIYPPKVPQKYTIYSADHTVYRYLHFTGSSVAELLTSVGITPSMPIEVKSTLISVIFDHIQDCMADGSSLSGLKAEYQTLYLIAQIATGSGRLSEIHLMKRITDNMEHNFTESYNAAHYADMLNLSISRFDHLFKQCMGISPYAYYIRLRIANACNLLESTSLKIKDIATKCGYQDAMYFTQAFKKETGMTPSAWRRAQCLYPGK